MCSSVYQELCFALEMKRWQEHRTSTLGVLEERGERVDGSDKCGDIVWLGSAHSPGWQRSSGKWGSVRAGGCSVPCGRWGFTLPIMLHTLVCHARGTDFALLPFALFTFLHLNIREK